MMTTTFARKIYTIDMLRDDAKELVYKGLVDRQQPLYALCRYLPNGEWECAEVELEKAEFLLRDRIIDLLSNECWAED